MVKMIDIDEDTADKLHRIAEHIRNETGKCGDQYIIAGLSLEDVGYIGASIELCEAYLRGEIDDA